MADPAAPADASASAEPFEPAEPADSSETVRQLMVPSPVTVDAGATVESAAHVMRENDIGDVLVTENGHLRGIVTDRDIVVRAVAAGRLPSATAVAEICSPYIQVVDAADPPSRAAEIMRDSALRRLPVVDQGHLVGILSIGDLAVAADPNSPLAAISSAPPNL
jgi:CBS domain-containing protein